jgi:hypothetical protein
MHPMNPGAKLALNAYEGRLMKACLSNGLSVNMIWSQTIAGGSSARLPLPPFCISRMV